MCIVPLINEKHQLHEGGGGGGGRLQYMRKDAAHSLASCVVTVTAC